MNVFEENGFTKRVARLFTFVVACIFAVCLISACNPVIEQVGSPSPATLRENPLYPDNPFFDALNNFEDLEEVFVDSTQNDDVEVIFYHYLLDFPFYEGTWKGITVSILHPFVVSDDSDVMATANQSISEKIYKIISGDFYAERLEYINETYDSWDLSADIWPGMIVEVICEIVYFSDSFVSFDFRTILSSGVRLSIGSALLTLNLSNGTIMALDEVFLRDDIINALELGWFSIEEGMYMPGGWRPDDECIRDYVAEVVMEGLNTNGTMRENVYGTFNLADFALLSETEALLWVRHMDSLYGFIIIKMHIA